MHAIDAGNVAFLSKYEEPDSDGSSDALGNMVAIGSGQDVHCDIILRTILTTLLQIMTGWKRGWRRFLIAGQDWSRQLVRVVKVREVAVQRKYRFVKYVTGAVW